MKSKILYFNLAIFIIVAASVFAAGFLLIKSTLPTSAADTDTTTIDDKVPPVISNIKIENTTATSTEISWETDENADSMINFGLDKRYGVEREPRADKIKHTILLEDLLPGQNYYFRAISTDAVGNQGISNDFSFLTTGESNNNVSLDSKTGYAAKILETGFGGLREKILELGKGGLSAVEKEQLLNMVDELAKEVSLDKGYKDSRIGDQAENITNQIVENIGQITSEGDLKEIDQAVKQRAAEISKPPEIILDNATVEVGIDYAIISWATDREANSMVSIAKEGDYEPDAEDPYVWKEGEPTEYVLGHQIT
ncbi:fibronectin type III domain-containing protein, partial [Patescibacteria group bacterium]|nr:fibronectin type III domain-containing protein [Patescibacteria group bacterium]